VTIVTGDRDVFQLMTTATGAGDGDRPGDHRDQDLRPSGVIDRYGIAPALIPTSMG